MTGMLLAAGLGERMEPLSSWVPKPALPVLGEPLLASSLRALMAAGCTRVVVNLHRHPEHVVAAVRHVARGTTVLFSMEPRLLGPGGGLAAARAAFASGSVLVANADCWSRLELAPLLAAGGPDRAVLALLPHPDRQRWGAVHLDGRGRVVGFSRAGENLRDEGFLFTGFQLLGSETLAALPQPPASMRAFWDALVAEGRLFGVEVRGSFREAGEPEAYWGLVMELLGSDSFVHPLAEVAGDAELGQTAVGPGCCVGSGARLFRCVVLPGSHVGPGACLAECLVAAPVPAESSWNRALLLPHGAYPLAPRR